MAAIFRMSRRVSRISIVKAVRTQLVVEIGHTVGTAAEIGVAGAEDVQAAAADVDAAGAVVVGAAVAGTAVVATAGGGTRAWNRLPRIRADVRGS